MLSKLPVLLLLTTIVGRRIRRLHFPATHTALHLTWRHTLATRRPQRLQTGVAILTPDLVLYSLVVPE
jgi:hypothetical protein